MIKQCFSIVIITLGCFLSIHAQVHINEWVASNSNGITDPDFGETADWIELYNNNSSEVELTGYFLTDNLTNPTKWRLPSLNIPPFGYAIIWADAVDQNLHANFKLSKEGEAIGLYNADTTLIEAIEFQHQKTNISMGRRVDGSAELGFFAEPTPGAPNAELSYEKINFYEPRFSISGGFYSEVFELELSAITGEIYYTLDGSSPHFDDLLYTEPILISNTTIVRAASLLPDQLPGKAITHSYFFDASLESRGLPVVSIVSEPDHFWDEEIGLYVQDFKPDWEYPINIELFENDGSDRAAFNELAGTKVNGRNSWELPQKMLGIYFDNDYDNNNLDYQLFFDRERKQYDNFILRASGNDWSHTLFRDALTQELTVENMDVERMGYRPAIAFINGEYMGIHNLRSRVDESYVEDNFGYSGSEYDLIENDGEVEQGDAVAYAEMVDLFNQDLTNETNYRKLTEVVDIRSFIDYFITELWSGNSSYGHNIQLWKPKNSNSKWRWIFTDLDRSLTISDKYGMNYFTTYSQTYYEFAMAMMRSALKNTTFKNHFITRLADHLHTTFHPITVEKAIDLFAKRLEPEMSYHIEKWGETTSGYGDGIRSISFWESAISELKQFAILREEYIIEDIKRAFGLEEVTSLTTLSLPPEAGSILINEIVIPESAWKGPYFKNYPFELTAVPKEGYAFLGWSSGRVETPIPKGSTWMYLDDGTDQGTEWKELSYDASSWKLGIAQLGYGDDGEETVIGFGSDEENKHLTTYFRRFIEVDKAELQPLSMDFELRRDDGAVVYLNGKEIYRTNMPNGAIHYDTKASAVTANKGEKAFYRFSADTKDLLQGTNLIAVEVHQQNDSISDMSFELELSMTISDGPFISNDELLEVVLVSNSVLVANYQSLDGCKLAGTIESDTRLTIDCSPYLVTEDLMVSEQVILSVDPGVELHFTEGTDLLINGGLSVEGTEAEPVIFSAAPRTEAWGGVIFRNSKDTSRVNWLELSSASKGDHPIYENAAISAFHAIVELDHVTIDDVYSNPILGYYSDIQLQNSYLHSAVTGDLINIKYGKGLVYNCEFRGNKQVDTDAIDYDDVESGVIRNNRIYDFLGFNSDGIDLGEGSKDIMVDSNFIYNCTDKAISVGQESTVIVEHNIIVNCNQGVAVKDLSTAEINRNTFYNVAVPIACFEKTVGLGGGFGTASNCILSNSPIAAYLEDEHSQLILKDVFSDTDTLLMGQGLNGHPRFISPTYFDFSLQPNSDAKDVGIDEDGSVIDLGSGYLNYFPEPTVMFSAINYNPADNTDAEFLDLYNPSSQTISLEGYVLSGGVELTFPAISIEPEQSIRLVKDADLFPSSSKIILQWEAGKLSNKGELIRLTDAYGIIIDQVIYNDMAPWPTMADGEGNFLRLKSPQLDNHFAESWVAEDRTTSAQEPDADKAYSLAPNPAKTWLELSSQSFQLNQISIMNSEGRLVQKVTSEGGLNQKIYIQELPDGIYYLFINGHTALPFVKVR